MTLVRFTCLVLRTKLAIVSRLWFGLHIWYFAQSKLLFHDFGSVYMSGTSHKGSYLLHFRSLVFRGRCLSCFLHFNSYSPNPFHLRFRLPSFVLFFTILLFSTLKDFHKQLGSASFFLLLFFNCNFHFVFRCLSLRCSYHIFCRSLVYFSRDFSAD